MPEDRIGFDSEDYELLITQLGTVINELTSITGSGPVPLSEKVKLQPDGQTWSPAVELVSAGEEFFGRKHAAVHTGLVPRLTNLRDGLIQARSVFQDVEDLATSSRADFVKDFPALDTATPVRLNEPW
jgi:hypothetical protein